MFHKVVPTYGNVGQHESSWGTRGSSASAEVTVARVLSERRMANHAVKQVEAPVAQTATVAPASENGTSPFQGRRPSWGDFMRNLVVDDPK